MIRTQYEGDNIISGAIAIGSIDILQKEVRLWAGSQNLVLDLTATVLGGGVLYLRIKYIPCVGSTHLSITLPAKSTLSHAKSTYSNRMINIHE